MDQFVQLFGPPPSTPPAPIDWDAVETWLRTPLPRDYKAIASAYGSIVIGNTVELQVPGDRVDTYGGFNVWLHAVHTHCVEQSAGQPPPFHPAPGGLLAWAECPLGYLLWDTGASDDPDEWPVVVFDLNDRDRWQHRGTPLVETLAAMVHSGLAPTLKFIPVEPWTPPVPLDIAPERRAALTGEATLETLEILVPPPEDPYLGEGTWDELFEQLGTRLPAEYVELMNRYGAGTWADWLNLQRPLRSGGRSVGEGLITPESWHLSGSPYPLWPETGGFLAFATTVGADTIGWLTEGEPDDWPLLEFPRHDDIGEPLSTNLIHTLLEWLRGRLHTPTLPGMDPLDDPFDPMTFDPWTRSD